MTYHRFWLGTCNVDPLPGAAQSMAEPLAGEGADCLAIEIITDGTAAFIVLFSVVDDVREPSALRCRIGFSNETATCRRWRERGFPLFDAAIDLDAAVVRVVTPFYDDQPSMRYGGMLITVEGVEFGTHPAANPYTSRTSVMPLLSTRYVQAFEAPDPLQPASVVRRKPVEWVQQRHAVRGAPTQPVRLVVARARSPNLRPFAEHSPTFVSAWTGLIEPDPVECADSRATGDAVSRRDVFGDPAFRFEDVEIIGFRFDLRGDAATAKMLAELIAPLNFHLEGLPGSGSRVPHFRYRVATHTVLLELLRYGRMKLAHQDAPLSSRDYQSQHELVVRILVGRVDDDTVQAHSPAVFVPAVFVDNPWSVVVGRDLQGFDKCLADFCQAEGSTVTALTPDGRRRNGELSSLFDIDQIRLIDRVPFDGVATGPLLMTLDYPDRVSSESTPMTDIDAATGMVSLPLGEVRWRQPDFDEPVFRRSFAHDAVRRAIRGFRSIQASPVDDRGGLQKSWISSRFILDDDVQWSAPDGPVRMTVHAPPSAPAGWATFCRLIQSRNDPVITFQSGNWYRLRLSTTMRVDDGLDWPDAD